MSDWKRRITNASLWRISAAFWLLNAVGNAVTASIASTPSVYLALGGVNVSLATLSWFVSRQYRLAEEQSRLVRLRSELPPLDMQPMSQPDEPVHSV